MVSFLSCSDTPCIGAVHTFVVGGNKAVAIVADSLDNAINKALLKYPNKFIKTQYAKAVERYITRLNDTERVKVTTNRNGYMSVSLVTDEDIIEEMIPNITTKVKHKFFMNLAKARKEAAQKSRDGKTIYINVTPAGDKDEGDCLLSDKHDETTFATFKNGSEIANPVQKVKKSRQVDVMAEARTAKGKANKKVIEDTDEEVSQSKQTNKVMAKTAKKASKEAPVKKSAAKKEAVKAAPIPKGKKEVAISEIIKLIKKGTKVYNHADKSLTLGYMEKMKDHSRTLPVSYAK